MVVESVSVTVVVAEPVIVIAQSVSITVIVA